jgi:surface protein
MFSASTSLTEIDLSSANTSKVTNFSYMFSSVRNTKEILGVLDLYSATNVSGIINDTQNLEKVTFKNIRRTLQIGSSKNYGTKLTLDTIINTIKELWDYSSGTTIYTLTMSTPSKELIANTYVKLIDVTDEMLAQDQYAANKLPCVVCDSTDEGAMTLTAYANLKNWTIA